MALTTGYVPFTYANKTIEELEKRPVFIDSLKRVYKKRWTIGLEYGLRFVSNSGRSTLPDTITLADFTSKRSFIGLEGGYFVSKDIQVFLAFDFMSLPKNQTITSLTIGGPNGIQVEGSGSGGAMVNVGIGGKYFFNVGAFTRIYTGLKLGIIKAVAEGGSGGFTLAQGQYQQTIKLAGQQLGAAHVRPEYNQPCASVVPQLADFPAEIWPEGTNIAALQQQLQEMFRTDFIRHSALLTLADGTVLEAVLDQGEVVLFRCRVAQKTKARPAQSFFELLQRHIDLVEAPLDDLGIVAALVGEHCGLRVGHGPQ